MSETVASVPGEVRVQWRRLIRFRPGLMVMGVLTAACMVAAVVLLATGVKAGTGLVIAGVVLGARVRQAVAVERMRYWRGMLLPGKVVGVQGRHIEVATLADLGKGGGGRFDVVLVRRFPRGVVGEARAGARVALCALYGPGGAPGAAHWMAFEPAPVAMATGDESWWRMRWRGCRGWSGRRWSWGWRRCRRGAA